jgi:hypothetical protein
MEVKHHSDNTTVRLYIFLYRTTVQLLELTL